VKSPVHDWLCLHPEARFDLDESWEYIRADNLEAANRVTQEILSAIRALVPFPHTGHRRTDLTSRPLRFIQVRDYLIAYPACATFSLLSHMASTETPGQP